jgi:hypothetical protein
MIDAPLGLFDGGLGTLAEAVVTDTHTPRSQARLYGRDDALALLTETGTLRTA